MKIHLDSPTNADEGRIELLPLIDVVFCILTFFILAALQLTRQQAINVDLPKASTGETQMQQMLIVGIDATGQIYVNQRQITGRQLDRELKLFLRRNADGLVVLYAPKDSRYNDVVQTLDQIRQVTSRVALATLPSSAETPAPNEPNLLNNPNLTNPNGLPNIPGNGSAPPPPPGLGGPTPGGPDGTVPENPLLLPGIPSEQPLDSGTSDSVIPDTDPSGVTDPPVDPQ
ncbi:MAG: biopolymer transporter ExbD [Oscillatoriales cyanobacterium RM2_1_1]|nr:biopolymer transporter ExbD [Oscillatoriales cyanobacterium SM2_3_0]NJO45276.1 biopolymer transporter ExbD [Oscillatoriales cyanobacterium RM2_1_1]